VKDGKEKYYAFSLNGTAVALSRALACIVETYQTAEGDVRVPKCLVPFMGREVL
jgi:seryl-tRNA synthetase